MGEEQKETESTEQEEKKEEEPSEIVLKVDMHCEGCARKVEKSLRKFEGVEDVKTDSNSNTVVVKGKTADPVKVCERVQKKTGKKVELISPLPKPPEEEEEKKEENKEAEEEKKEEPKSSTVILKVRMHCEACAQHLQKRIKKMEGVESVVTDLSNDQVIVKGIIDPGVLVEKVYKSTRKQASIVQDEENKEEEKKPEEEKKEEENKPQEEKKEEEKQPEEEKKEEEKQPEEQKKEEEKQPEEQKTEEEKKPEEEEKKEENKEEEKKEENKEEDKKEGEEGDEAKKYEHWPYRYPVEYAYTQHVFSDENPNACSVM